MSRDLTVAFKAAIAAGVVRPAFFVSAEFNSGTIYLWSGIGSIDWNGFTWVGVGNLGGISPISESGELRANNVTLSLSGIPQDMLGTVLAEIRTGKPCQIWLVLFDEDNQIIDAPYEAMSGRMDSGQIQEGAETAVASINVESELVDFQRPRDRHFTDQDQQSLYPGDLGFQYVPQIQNWPGKWGSR